MPDRLAAIWAAVENGTADAAEYEEQRKLLLAEYVADWADALLRPNSRNLVDSLTLELADYMALDPAEVVGRCRTAPDDIEREWRERVSAGDVDSIERFYDESAIHLYELTWWHTLAEDDSPLAYVVACRLARGRGMIRALDFGTGIGSGALLLAREGHRVTVADISSTLLDYTSWRFAIRGMAVKTLDLKRTSLPSESFDLILAMDVFEHLPDPVRTAKSIYQALAPGGVLFGRFSVEAEDARAEHVVKDMAPILRQFADLGLVQIWEDTWLWGHTAFRKPV